MSIENLRKILKNIEDLPGRCKTAANSVQSGAKDILSETDEGALLEAINDNRYKDKAIEILKKEHNLKIEDIINKNAEGTSKKIHEAIIKEL